MNDNHPPAELCESPMTGDGKKLTVICDQQANPDFVEMAAKLIRTNPDLAYVEIQDLAGRTILAYRGEHPGAEKFALNQSGET